MNLFKKITAAMLKKIEFFLQRIILPFILTILYLLIFPIGKLFFLLEIKKRKKSYFTDFTIEEDKEFYKWQS